MDVCWWVVAVALVLAGHGAWAERRLSAVRGELDRLTERHVALRARLPAPHDRP